MRRLLLPLVAVCLFANCSRREPALPRDQPGLHNVLRVSDKLLSGSGPEGDEGFGSLKKLGVKTIISVDGARPDVERAREHGMCYVHLPIGYDGVPRAQALRIARAVRDLPGPVYLHCHHGKHRGPAAAAVAKRCLDATCSAEDAVALLTEAGTATRYRGLYASAEGIERPSDAELDAVSADFPEAAEVNSLVRLMVEMDRRWGHLEQVRRAGWKSPPDHPDLDPAHEAVQLWELYRESARLAEVKERPRDFRRWLADGERSAKRLADALKVPTDFAATRDAFESSAKVCAGCHARHRDAPK
jgi:protein tyrosine phosphatase (PTP) superfamily phosphohydrolase (DUF442 family)